MIIINEIRASPILLSFNHDFSAMIDVDPLGYRFDVKSPSINSKPCLLKKILSFFRKLCQLFDELMKISKIGFAVVQPQAQHWHN